MPSEEEQAIPVRGDNRPFWAVDTGMRMSAVEQSGLRTIPLTFRGGTTLSANPCRQSVNDCNSGKNGA